MTVAEMPKLSISRYAEAVLSQAKSVQYFGSVAELVEAAVPEDKVDKDGYYTVGYDVDGQFRPEARVCRVKNGIAANYLEPYMRRRDPECMVIADEKATDKQTFQGRFGKDFEPIRQETFEWLKKQDLACFFFDAGRIGKGMPVNGNLPEQCRIFRNGLSDAPRNRPLGRDFKRKVSTTPIRRLSTLRRRFGTRILKASKSLYTIAATNFMSYTVTTCTLVRRPRKASMGCC